MANEMLKVALKSIDDFAAQELPDSRLIELDERDEFPEKLVRRMSSGDELGIQLLFVPYEYGGMGGGAFDVYRICERKASIDLGIATSELATFLGSDPIRVEFMVGVFRWTMRVHAYVFLQTDAYPPFTLDDVPTYPVRLEIDYPEHIARWHPLVNWLLAIPAYIGAALIYIVAEIGVFIAFFAILFTARYPQALFDTVTIALRWSARVGAFGYWMTEQYPPFVWG